MKPVRKKLTLDHPTEYCIEVQGLLDKNWSDWTEAATASVEIQGDSQPVTTITVVVDQAALQGLLRRLYALGLPLISVQCVYHHG
jgi:hypothetical protein